MVTTASALARASAGEPATVTPSSASGSARAAVRFQALTSSPARRRLRAIGAPMMPVPRTATRDTDSAMDAAYPLGPGGMRGPPGPQYSRRGAQAGSGTDGGRGGDRGGGDRGGPRSGRRRHARVRGG